MPLAIASASRPTTDYPKSGDVVIRKEALDPGAHYSVRRFPAAPQVACASWDVALRLVRTLVRQERVDVWEEKNGSYLRTEPKPPDWLEIVRSEFREMPGLCLTEQQAQRLWSLDRGACHSLLEHLTRTGFLRRTSSGGYVRADVS
jgi:hypothetical protein